ncbi:AFR723Cp [Eremothecium gossypii ATCC 10895]|uniref:AFR723Cp n=1 Tax=Eremothecium gossypii (strain ATCC 10895 / CBS 109.51 / FGSC 9923 / NRRL Y-1056) TaxID=284811 RepID=Q751V2_EREGS|nr:AFR723Cp [Eremothecium gossypii ATCC 10895]AAS54095.1 AFR723Cp [Eremothecium gossypii ATCC 10895]AEY98410.1 FAFR723Cp [Eremothecium gossypii FDAG1]
MKVSHIISLVLTTSQLCTATWNPSPGARRVHDRSEFGILQNKSANDAARNAPIPSSSHSTKAAAPSKAVSSSATTPTAAAKAKGSALPMQDEIKRLPEFCKKDYHYIQNAIQLNQLQSECNIVDGNIYILGYQEPVIDLGNINTIVGDLIIEQSSELLRVQGRNLNYIGQTFKLHDLTSLTEVDLPRLKHFTTLYWRVVPILQTVTMEPRISSVRSVLISDTSLITIEGFYGAEELEILNINNNRYMDHIKTDVKRITTQLSISANSENLAVEMPELLVADNVTIRDAASVDFPKLEYVNQSLELIENNFESLEMPKLKRIGGTFGLIDNKNLEKINLASVTVVSGGLMVSNNTKLTTLDFLPELQQVGGAIHFEGTIEDTRFPKLRLVKGSAMIDSGEGKLDCSKWTRPLSGNSIVRGGQLECTSAGKRNTVSVSKDGVVIDRDTTEVVHPNENSAGSIMSKNQLGKLVWSLGFGWMVFLLIFVTLQ